MPRSSADSRYGAVASGEDTSQVTIARNAAAWAGERGDASQLALDGVDRPRGENARFENTAGYIKPNQVAGATLASGPPARHSGVT